MVERCEKRYYSDLIYFRNIPNYTLEEIGGSMTKIYRKYTRNIVRVMIRPSKKKSKGKDIHHYKGNNGYGNFAFEKCGQFHRSACYI
jgi:hypothetical protein